MTHKNIVSFRKNKTAGTAGHYRFSQILLMQEEVMHLLGTTFSGKCSSKTVDVGLCQNTVMVNQEHITQANSGARYWHGRITQTHRTY